MFLRVGAVLVFPTMCAAVDYAESTSSFFKQKKSLMVIGPRPRRCVLVVSLSSMVKTGWQRIVLDVNRGRGFAEFVFVSGGAGEGMGLIAMIDEAIGENRLVVAMMR